MRKRSGEKNRESREGIERGREEERREGGRDEGGRKSGGREEGRDGGVVEVDLLFSLFQTYYPSSVQRNVRHRS